MRFHFKTLLIFFREGTAPSGERSSNSTSPLLEFAEKNNMNILEVQLVSKLHLKSSFTIYFHQDLYNLPSQPTAT